MAKQLRRDSTAAESRLWGALCGKALGCRVRSQHVIRGWIVDFYIASARLVIELDGDVHDLCAEEDAQRTITLEHEGLRVLRFRNDAVLDNVSSVVAAIAAAIDHDP